MGKIVAMFQRMPGPMVLCHGDAYLDNVLARESEADPNDPSKPQATLLMLVDWEDSCLSNPSLDLAACAVGTCFSLSLGEGSEDVKVELIKDRLVALVAGYQKVRILPDAERSMLQLMMQACAWACGAFRYGRFLEGVTDVKTRKYGQLLEVIKILEDMGEDFNAVAFSGH